MNKSTERYNILLASPFFKKIGGGEEQIKLIDTYVDLLLKWNRKINLTGIYDRNQIINTLIFESLYGLEFIPHSGNLLDLGSGAGIPGLVLKFFRPELRVYLVESREKKAAFLKEAVRALSLKKVNVLNCSFEIVHQPGNLSERSIDAITVRAVRITDTILKGALKLLSPEGSLLLYSYLTEQDQVDIPKFGFKLQREITNLGRNRPILYSYRLPGK